MTCNIAINGFFGRMGQSIFEASINHRDVRISVGCDVDEKISSAQNAKDLILTSQLQQQSDMFDVVIDFTLPESSIEVIKHCLVTNKPITIGTTGFTQEQKKFIKEASKKIPILIAPNMSQGVNTSLDSLASMAKSLRDYSVNIKEIHHVNKIDAPSGTAIKMAEVICKSRGIDLGDVKSEACPIKFESIRERTEIGTHEVIFKNKSDEIRLIHIAKDRSIFADGAIETAMWVKNQKAGLYTYNDYMVSK